MESPEPTPSSSAAGAARNPAPQPGFFDFTRTPPGGIPALQEDRERLERRSRREQWRAVLSMRLLTTFALVLTIVTVITFGLAGLFIKHTTEVALEDQLGRHLEAVAQVAARRFNDPTKLVPALRSRERRGYLDDLARRLQEDARVGEVVLFVCSGDDAAPDIEVLAAARASDEAARTTLQGRLLADAIWIAQARINRAPASSSLYVEPEGLDASSKSTAPWRKSAYMPVRTADGRELAVVGVELPVDFRPSVEAVLWQLLLLGTAAGATVLFVAVFIVRQRVHNPIYRLVRAMQGEEAGGPPRRAKLRWNDEIGVLTECYNAMVDRLAEKDEKLRELYDRAQRTAAYLQGYSSQLVAGVPSGVVATDATGRVTVWNESAARILEVQGPPGRTVSEAMGSDHPLTRALVRALAGSVTDQAIIVLDPGRSNTSQEARVPPSEASDVSDPKAEGEEPDDEQQRMVELTCAPFRDERGVLLGAAALITDRTELERFRRVASRNERLAAIGTLGAGLAHEIKNPLGAISGFAELIERREGQDAARLAARLRHEVEELNRFLGEFLAFARDDTLRREPHDLRELLRRSIEIALNGVGLDHDATARALAGEEVRLPGGVPLRLRLNLADVPLQAVDGALMRSTFVNLVKNAVQAMAGTGKGGELAVRLSRLEDVLYVRVKDQGPGIPLDMRERIFDPLFTTRAEGTGLGLAIVHKAITAHGGKISVRDAPGGGAELIVRLPCVGSSHDPSALDRPTPVSVGAIDTPTPGPGKLPLEDTSTWRAS